MLPHFIEIWFIYKGIAGICVEYLNRGHKNKIKALKRMDAPALALSLERPVFILYNELFSKTWRRPSDPLCPLAGSPSDEKQGDVIWIITALVTSWEQKDL